MKNLQFIREDSGLTLRELSELTWISYSLLQQIEKGKRRLTTRNSETLQRFFCVTAEFLENESPFGIFCENGLNPPDGYCYEILSLTEYKTQRAIGNIFINPRFKNPPYSEAEIEDMKNTCPDDWETINNEWLKPYVKRSIKESITTKDTPETEAMKNEIKRLVTYMGEAQLRKTLLMIKEVILK